MMFWSETRSPLLFQVTEVQKVPLEHMTEIDIREMLVLLNNVKQPIDAIIREVKQRSEHSGAPEGPSGRQRRPSTSMAAQLYQFEEIVTESARAQSTTSEKTVTIQVRSR